MVLEKTLESPLNSKEIKVVNPKGNQPWILIGSTDAEVPILATWCKQGTHWKSPWCWERLKAGKEGDIGWDCWMATLIQWTWTWANSGRWWDKEAWHAVVQWGREESDRNHGLKNSNNISMFKVGSYKQHIVGSCILILSNNLCFLIDVFSPLALKLIIDIIGLIASKFATIFYLLPLSFVSTFVIFLCLL